MLSERVKEAFGKLFYSDGKDFVVVSNRDGFLLREDVRGILSERYGTDVLTGDSLSLRLAWERRSLSPGRKVLFVKSSGFALMEDIALGVEELSYESRWEEKQVLEEAVSAKGVPDLGIISEELRWEKLMKRVDFHKPGEWMNEAGELMLSVLQKDEWGQFRGHLSGVNERFLAFLQSSYVNIVASSVGKSAPRIVTQVLPFIARQSRGRKKALVVVDGMNYWQGMMLKRCLEAETGVSAKCDCLYAWLPSVTELSRQAVFRGEAPDVEYVQSPGNEKGLWASFWAGKGVTGKRQFYQHGGEISDAALGAEVLAYVTVDLDDKMHASDDYLYLYDSTKRWLKDGRIAGIVRKLTDSGFSVYITTDHGNMEGVGYRSIDSKDRVDAWKSLRHITISEKLNKDIFEKQYVGHLCQVDSSSRTYYACGEELFSSKERCVTHGGTHFMEVLIPFITIDKK